MPEARNSAVRWLLVLVAMSAVWLLTVAPAPAQESRGSISGQVTDASGAVVPGVAVSATNTATNLSVSAITDPGGHYSLLYLPAGRYGVSAELQGFKKVVRNGV